jgi:hypothetical protein
VHVNFLHRWLIRAALLLTTSLAAGCSQAPSFDILGSYFPAWLLCILAGIAVASIVASSLSKLGKENLIRWTILVYPCLAASVAFTLWLFFFG